MFLKSYFLCEKSVLVLGCWAQTFPSFVPHSQGEPLAVPGPDPACDGHQMHGDNCLVLLRADGGEITPPQHADKYGR